MRLCHLVLAAVIAVLSGSDATSTKNVGQAILSNEDLTPATYVRTSSDEIDHAEDEETGFNNQAFRSAKVRLKSKMLTADPKIKKQFDTFKLWYKKGNTPDDAWDGLKLESLTRQYFKESGNIDKLKADPDYQRYLLYGKFYRIVTNNGVD